MQHTDVAIIGAGPVGLFAIFQCGMLGLKTHVIDALDSVGGQCRALYPEKPIYDIPAYPEILAGKLIDNLEEQARPFAPVYHLGQRVESVQKDGRAWVITTSQGVVIHAKAIIIAAGVGAFGPNRPPLQDIDAYEGAGVLYYVKSRTQFAGKSLVIAGGGDSAVDWAVNLADIARKIYVIHRRDKFRAAHDMVSKMEALATQGVVEILTPYQLHGLMGEAGHLRQVEIVDLEGKIKTLDADYLLAFFGLSMNLGPIAEWGLQIDNKHITVDSTTLQTSTAGIFAIGDVAHYPHKLKLILTGFSEGAQAAHQARQYIYPDQTFHFEHSTTKGVPK